MNSVSVLDLRSIFGVHARITKSGSTTGGAFVEMDCTAEPGSGTMVHFHPEQDESFEVVVAFLRQAAEDLLGPD